MPSPQKKYTTLVSNTLLFAISNFSSKLLSFFIRPYLSYALDSPDVMGVSSLLQQATNLLIPVVSLGVAYAVIRFGLDKAANKSSVFVNGAATIGLGFVVLLLLISLRSEPITSKVIYAVEDNALCGQTGLQAGDEIVAVNGRHCFVANDMLYELMRTESYRAAFTVRRDGKLVELPDVQFDTWQDAQGQTHMTLGFTVYGLKKTPKNVLKEAANSVIYYGRIIYTSLADLLRGRESINDLSGPVGIVTAIGQAASYGWEDVFELLALITINLGVLNLLPFPALDGGKIVFLLIEAVTGHAVPEKIQGSLTVAAFALLFGLMLFATYNDIVRLVTGAI